jgi:type II secretory ATPase GspE/PulE/Tfp pilus assembly ATPase PilB-like protein
LLGAGPDQGRTTTMYSVVQMHDAYTSNVQTIEMDPQWAIDGVRANKFDAEKEGAEYSTTVRSVLRRDPQVVFVAEIPDQATAKEIAKADLSRARVFVSTRADNAVAAVEGWVKAVGDPKMASTNLRGVLAQRLLRKLCSNCKVGYPATPDMLKKMGVSGDKAVTLFKKGGQVLIKNKPEVCPVCQGGGYIGQEAVFEVYQIGDEERAHVEASNMAGLRASLKKRQLPTIQQAAIRKAVDGITSVEEVTRITAAAPATPAPTNPGQPGAPRATPAPAGS